ncbi:peptidyl-prolyl cis-trans isomerase CYP63 [Rosa rugosa]|uniref:peptidyl-prolyl cis-trans isomerase CYP63 n=1 Tax=Rosa rugosa TaxID=74645 RepID=UPI002B40A8A2|nr:peptidyl-prolyl cis-trans isomerase CYP63 [Rosa rugosa]
MSPNSNREAMLDEEDSMELDSLVVEKCLRCSGDCASGKLLVCSVIGCPISVHEECMCCKPEIDEKGRFYCPYCAYKRALVREEKLRRKAMQAKEILSMFIDSGRVNFAVNDGEGSSGNGGGEGTSAGIGAVRDEVTVGRGMDGGETEDRSLEVEENGHGEMDEDVSKGNSDQQCVSERREFDKRNEDDAVDGIDRGDGDSIRGNEENEGKSPGEELMRPEAMEVPADDTVVPESGDFQSGSPLLRKRRYKQRAQKIVQLPYAVPVRIVPSPSTKSSSCQTDAVEEDAEKQSEKDATSYSSESRKVSESDQNVEGTISSKSRDIPESNPNQKATTSSKSRKSPESNQNEKVTTSCFESRKVPESNQNEKATTSLSSESREIPEPNQNEKATTAFSKSRKDPDSNQNEKTTTSSTEPIKVLESGSEELLFHNAKRRKIKWTAEELKMLKDGVRLFSAQVNKNLPWRKILELGKAVFHETRTPDNLKDKWKLLSREAAKKNKLDHLDSK